MTLVTLFIHGISLVYFLRFYPRRRHGRHSLSDTRWKHHVISFAKQLQWATFRRRHCCCLEISCVEKGVGGGGAQLVAAPEYDAWSLQPGT